MSSGHDKAVLDAIFNPYLPLGEAVSFQQDNHVTVTDSQPEVEGESQAKSLEVEAVKRAEAGLLKEAVNMLTTAMGLAPGRASLFNNRAQVYLLLGKDDAALLDLDQAIELSGGEGVVARQALCQRVVIHRRRGDETKAALDLRTAAALGSDWAKQQLVQMNPYAAMCNQMLRQMFTKLQQPA